MFQLNNKLEALHFNLDKSGEFASYFEMKENGRTLPNGEKLMVEEKI